MIQLNWDVLLPQGKDEFFQDIWEKRYLHIPRGNAEYFSTLIDDSAIERFLSTATPQFPQVQIVHHERDIAPAEYTDSDNQISIPQMLNHIGDGATLVISEAHRRFAPIAELCRTASHTLHMRTQANVYRSPAGNQGFRSHYDTHDVFILQVSGVKTFRFYESDVELPFPEDEYDPEQNTHADVVAEVRLNPGDTLYIPRGLVHDAVAQPTQPSLHITLGVFPIVIRDLLQEAVQVLAEKNVSLRHTVRFDDTPETPDIQPDINRLISDALCSEEVLHQAQARLADNFAVNSQPRAAIEFAEGVGASTEFQFCDRYWRLDMSQILSCQRNGNEISLRMHGQVMRFHDPMAAAVEWMSERSEFQIKAIPGLDKSQQEALCRHLLSTRTLSLVSK